MFLINKLHISDERKSTLMYIWVYVNFFWVCIVKNVYGFLFLSICVHYFSSVLFNVEAFDGPQLALWFSEQPSDTKGLLMSSMLTIVGFIIAFSVAMSGWKSQMKMSLRLDAAQDLNSVYTRVCNLITSIRIYADTVVKTKKEILQDTDQEMVKVRLFYLKDAQIKFMQDRQELSSMSSDVHNILGRHSNVFFAAGDSFEKIIEINQTINQISAGMWSIPEFNFEIDLNFIREIFLDRVNLTELEDFSKECEKAHHSVSGISGYVKGKIISRLAEDNLSMHLNMIKHGKWIFPVMLKILSKQELDSDLIKKVESNLIK